MKINKTAELINFFRKKAQLQIEIQLVALKIISWRPMAKKKKKTPKSYDMWIKQTYFLANQG
jgi:hypothetical protein